MASKLFTFTFTFTHLATEATTIDTLEARFDQRQLPKTKKISFPATCLRTNPGLTFALMPNNTTVAP